MVCSTNIFGPTRDWECACSSTNGSVTGSSVTVVVSRLRSKVRRERMGHIELAAPVSYLVLQGIPSRMGLVLDMSPCLPTIIYFASYVVIDPGDTVLERNNYWLNVNIVKNMTNMAKASKQQWALKPSSIKRCWPWKRSRWIEGNLKTAQGQSGHVPFVAWTLEAFRNQ